MGTIIPLHGDPHDRAQQLLPWYVNGTLEPGEKALVEEHLSACADCRAELASEERLASLVSAVPPAPEGQWEALRRRALASPRPAIVQRRQARRWAVGPGRLGLIAASYVALIGLLVALYGQLRSERSEYHTLSAPAATPRGNLLVAFRPETSERDLRRALQAVGARIVNGPTAGNAYVLAVAPDRLASATAQLRAQGAIALAQPIDGSPEP